MNAPFPSPCLEAARDLLDACRRRGWMLVTAESCTGGLIAACLTENAGSSDVVERGLVTYSNAAKMALLGVRETTLERDGAVSERTAREMAEGALERSPATLAIAVTGIAGPGGATPAKPVGLVHLACAVRGGSTTHRRCVFEGDRAAVRLAAVEAALRLALEAAAPSTGVA
jgi:nicotinamide-nucleotide amidase